MLTPNTEPSPPPGPILVVEDDEEIRETIALVLGEQGYETVVATNGAEALELVRQRRPRLILLDMMMPVMSGWELCTVLSEDAALATIPIVLLSGDAHVVERSGGGIARALVKPISLAQLLEVAEEFH